MKVEGTIENQHSSLGRCLYKEIVFFGFFGGLGQVVIHTTERLSENEFAVIYNEEFLTVMTMLGQVTTHFQSRS